MTQAETIRRALKRDTVLMPGVYDALSARIAKQHGAFARTRPRQ